MLQEYETVYTQILGELPTGIKKVRAYIHDNAKHEKNVIDVMEITQINDVLRKIPYDNKSGVFYVPRQLYAVNNTIGCPERQLVMTISKAIFGKPNKLHHAYDIGGK